MLEKLEKLEKSVVSKKGILKESKVFKKFHSGYRNMRDILKQFVFNYRYQF